MICNASKLILCDQHEGQLHLNMFTEIKLIHLSAKMEPLDFNYGRIKHIASKVSIYCKYELLCKGARSQTSNNRGHLTILDHEIWRYLVFILPSVRTKFSKNFQSKATVLFTLISRRRRAELRGGQCES